MSDESQKLRLKPRLLPDAAPSPAEEPIPEASAFTPPPVAEVPPPLPAQDTPPAFRLKPKLVEQVAAGAPPPVVLNAPAPATAAVPPPVGRSPSELEAAGKKVQFAALVIGAVGAVVFAVVGYLAYSSELFASDSFENEGDVAFEEAEPVDNSRTSPPESAPQTSPTEITPQAPVAPAIPPATVETPAPVNVTNEAAAEPSAAFRAYVSGLKILGVRAGANPRVLIERSSYNVGATINAELGVVFVSYDAAQRTIRFKDASGAIIDRPDR